MSPGWVSALMGVLGVVFSAGVAWGVFHRSMRAYRDALAAVKVELAEYKAKAEKDRALYLHDRENMNTVVGALRDAIREEFDGAIRRINKLLFEDAGTTRYLPRLEWEKGRDWCRSDLMERIRGAEDRVRGAEERIRHIEGKGVYSHDEPKSQHGR